MVLPDGWTLLLRRIYVRWEYPGENWPGSTYGHETNFSSPLAQTRWFQLASVSYFTHSHARAFCQGVMAFPEYWRESPKPKSCPLSLGRAKVRFPPRLALPYHALFYRLCQDRLFFAPSGSAAFHALCHIPPVRSPGVGDWTPKESHVRKSPDRKRSNPCYSPVLQPLLHYRISSWDSAKPCAVSRKCVLGQCAGLTYLHKV